MFDAEKDAQLKSIELQSIMNSYKVLGEENLEKLKTCFNTIDGLIEKWQIKYDEEIRVFREAQESNNPNQASMNVVYISGANICAGQIKGLSEIRKLLMVEIEICNKNLETNKIGRENVEKIMALSKPLEKGDVIKN